jgi:ABC-type glycerol-3-phosphate transport system substrate-binding protein
MNYRRTLKLATALAAAAALAACSGASEETAPAENAVNAMELTEDLPEENIAEPAPLVVENTATAPVTETVQPDEAQIQDDAEATGMTARVQRGDTSGNQTAPVE